MCKSEFDDSVKSKVHSCFKIFWLIQVGSYQLLNLQVKPLMAIGCQHSPLDKLRIKLNWMIDQLVS